MADEMATRAEAAACAPAGRILRSAGGALLCAALLAACSEPEEILPGEREGLRSVLQEPELDVPQTNQSRAIALGGTVANSEWAQFWGTPAFRTSHPALSPAPQLIWATEIGQGNSRRQRVTASPVVGGGRIYTLDSGTRVSAIARSGATLWSRDLQPTTDRAGEATGGGLAYADGRLYVNSGFGFLTVLDAATGGTVWEQQLDATASGAPTVLGELVYLTAGDDTGWALERANGRIRWQIGAPSSVRNVLGAPSPVLAEDLAIFAFGSGSVQAVFRRGGLRRWDAAAVGERRGYASAQIGDITGGPVIDGDRAYIGNQSGRIVAVSLSNGERIWTANEGAMGPIWPAGDSLFVVTDLNELVRLSKADGSRIWGVELPDFINDRPRRRAARFAHYGPVVAGGRVVLASSDGVLRSFDPRDGRLVHSVELPGGAASDPALAGGVLYVLNRRGQLLAFR